MRRVALVMGVAGVGKTTVGMALAAALGWTFLDADDDHSPHNIAKMTRGEPLTDAERDGWIEAVRARVARHVERGIDVVLACSALRRAHRARLVDVPADVRVVHLVAPPAVIEARLRGRTGHFAGPGLLPSQLHDLELPRRAIEVDATLPVADIVADIRARLAL